MCGVIGLGIKIPNISGPQSSGGGGGGDPLFDNVELLINGQTGAVDQSSRSRSFVVSSLPTSTENVIGAQNFQSFEGDGVGYLQTAETGVFSFQNGSGVNLDFCVEFWMETIAGFGTNDGFYSTGAGDSSRQVIWFGSGGFIQIFAGGAPSSSMLSHTTSIADGLPHHVAWTREGSLNSLWIDGAPASGVATVTNAHVYPFSVTAEAHIGEDNITSGRVINNVLMDGIRITVGNARYTASFTPPVLPLPTS